MLHQLSGFLQGVSKHAGKWDPTDIMHLDFQKALSELPHQIKTPYSWFIKALSNMKNSSNDKKRKLRA